MHSIIRITTTIEATQTVAWPHFAGSTLRGAFGRALRRAACITGQDQCTGCPLRNSCAYGVVFDPAPPPQPLHPSFQDGLPRYMVQPPALGACQLTPGQTQSFTLMLLPGAHPHRQLIEHILPTLATQQLMQAGHFKLQSVRVQETPALFFDQPPSAPQHPSTQATLRWHTPLRLQQKGKPIFKPQDVDSTTLIRALLRRQLQWCQLTAQTPPDTQTSLQAASACTLDTSNLHWHDIQRHSGSQNQKIPLGGLIGSAKLHGPPQALDTLRPVLQLGEQLHIGKETIMGLGCYQLTIN